MSSFKRSVRRNKIRRIAQATGIPMRHLWRAHQGARHMVNQGYQEHTPWYEKLWAKVVGVGLILAVVVWAILTMSAGRV